MDRLQIMTRQLDNGVMSISLKGYLNNHTQREFERVISWLFKHHIYTFILDLSQVDGISCDGISVLLGTFAMVKKNHGDLIICRPRPKIKKVLKLFGLTHLFTIEDDIATAFTALLNPPTRQYAVR